VGVAALKAPKSKEEKPDWSPSRGGQQAFNFTDLRAVMVGLGHKLTTKKLAALVGNSAEYDDWRVDSARSCPEIVSGRATIAVIAFGVHHDQVGPMKLSQFDRLVWAPCFDGRGAMPMEQGAENFT
jgi:hypothetical protein